MLSEYCWAGEHTTMSSWRLMSRGILRALKIVTILTISTLLFTGEMWWHAGHDEMLGMTFPLSAI